jgi:DnaJ-class molecular chaperone
MSEAKDGASGPREAETSASADTGTSRPQEEERPGDPVCWLRRVCPHCGGIADEDPPTTCRQCHTEMTGD